MSKMKGLAAFPGTETHVKMRQFVLGERNGTLLYLLAPILERIDSVYRFVRPIVQNGGHVVFCGNRRESLWPLEHFAKKCNMPYVTKWAAGSLTNFANVHGRVVPGSRVRHFTQHPEALFLLDGAKQRAAVYEAHKTITPTIAVVDVASDPTLYQFVIPGPTDPLRSAALMSWIIRYAQQPAPRLNWDQLYRDIYQLPPEGMAYDQGDAPESRRVLSQ